MGSLTLSVSVQAFVVTELIINTKEAEEEGAHLSDVYWAEWVHCSKDPCTQEDRQKAPQERDELTDGYSTVKSSQCPWNMCHCEMQ